MMLKKLARVALATGVVFFAGGASAQVKIGLIDPMTGPFANIGDGFSKAFQMSVDEVNAKGGVLGGQKLELVKLDNKGSPQESLVVLQSAIDRGIQFITQGSGSGAAHALVEGIAKNNRRNPDKLVLFLNHSAVDPTLTNEKCNFWHFRFDANSDMKMEAITNFMTPIKAVKKLYIIGQDYAHGHQVTKAAKEMLARKRPDIKIVGDDLHPIGRVKDFAPYVAKIKASGADTVITGNWGNDLTLLIKAAKEAGLSAKFFTYYAGGQGGPAAMGEAGAGNVVQVSEYNSNITPNNLEGFANDFRKKYDIDFTTLRTRNTVMMLVAAINKAGSTDPLKVALALEDMRYPGDTGEVWMRKSDHQLMQPLYVSTFAKKDGKAVKYDAEGTGYGWKNDTMISMRDSQLPTTCVMERPQ